MNGLAGIQTLSDTADREDKTHLTTGGNAVTIVMTYPPSLSLETGEAQIGGFFFFL
jgi:hypothetical protein